MMDWPQWTRKVPLNQPLEMPFTLLSAGNPAALATAEARCRRSVAGAKAEVVYGDCRVIKNQARCWNGAQLGDVRVLHILL